MKMSKIDFDIAENHYFFYLAENQYK